MESININNIATVKECPVCYESISNNHNSCTTDCGHSFCFTCMMKCIQKNNSCPICRHVLLDDKPKTGHLQYEVDDDEEEDDDEEYDDEDDNTVDDDEYEEDEEYNNNDEENEKRRSYAASVELIISSLSKDDYHIHDIIDILIRPHLHPNSVTQKFFNIIHTCEIDAHREYFERCEMNEQDKPCYQLQDEEDKEHEEHEEHKEETVNSYNSYNYTPPVDDTSVD